jgi:3-methylfumaryl-CoA hydratase
MFEEYVNKQERRSDALDAHRIRDMAAVLDVDFDSLAPEGRLPLLGHWLYFNPWAPQSQIGADGHPRRGGFLPPIALPRRMFAGGRIAHHHPLRIGDAAERVSTIISIQQKTGASGELVFVTVKHEIFDAAGLAIEEEQDIVYRGASPAAPPAAPKSVETLPQDAVRKPIVADPVLLFRFSALTSNSHRIHYDRPYAAQIEGYPGLVVHGPLQAVLLADLVRERFAQIRPARFTFAARKPLFEGDAFECVGVLRDGAIELSTRNERGESCMTARVLT